MDDMALALLGYGLVNFPDPDLMGNCQTSMN